MCKEQCEYHKEFTHMASRIQRSFIYDTESEELTSKASDDRFVCCEIHNRPSNCLFAWLVHVAIRVSREQNLSTSTKSKEKIRVAIIISIGSNARREWTRWSIFMDHLVENITGYMSRVFVVYRIWNFTVSKRSVLCIGSAYNISQNSKMTGLLILLDTFLDWIS
jgi:hypothetical protein